MGSPKEVMQGRQRSCKEDIGYRVRKSERDCIIPPCYVRRQMKINKLCSFFSSLCLIFASLFRRHLHGIWGSVQSVCSSIDLILLFFSLVFIVLGVIFKAKHHLKGFSAFFAPIFLFLFWIILMFPVLTESEQGTIREAVDSNISANASIKEASLIRDFDSESLTTHQIELLNRILEEETYSTCVPYSALRPLESHYTMYPRLLIVLNNPDDTSKTYYLHIFYIHSSYGILKFQSSSDSSFQPIVCRLEAPELYSLIHGG